jgi:putative DNA primase/helicase
MSYDKLPPELQVGTYFCLYKLEPDKKGKKKKVPYQINGARADPGNEAHLTDFKTAYDTYVKSGYDGIGLSVKE